MHTTEARLPLGIALKRGGELLHSRPILLVAFAFAVMADPVSSVAYAVEAALRSLHGNLSLLLPTMGIVVGLIALVIVNYHQLVAYYPQGGGAAAAAGEAFGDGYAFIPIGALIVDFALTIAISASAGSSAIIAYLPSLAAWRVPLTLALIAYVASLTWFGHFGRTVFATMTLGFIAVATLVLLHGLGATPPSAPVVESAGAASGSSSMLMVLLAFPVAMALATGVEAPSSAIAQLGQLDDSSRRRFGRITLWLTLMIVGTITLGLTAEAVRLGVGIPQPESTQMADLARVAAPHPLFAAFQAVTALLLLAACSSSFQAGPGLLKALARRGPDCRDGQADECVGILPRFLGVTNQHHTPYWGVLVFALVSGLVALVAGGEDQRLVLFYAVSVFLSFLAGLLAMARFSWRDRQWGFLAVNALGTAGVAFTLLVNLARGEPIVSLAVSLLIAALLCRLWVRAGRPQGIRNVVG